MPAPTTEFTMLESQLEHLVAEHEDRQKHWVAYSNIQKRRIARLEGCIERGRYLAQAQVDANQDGSPSGYIEYLKITQVLGGGRSP